MKVFQFEYGVSKFDFLDLFNNIEITPGTWITTARSFTLVERDWTTQLESTSYNFAQQSSHDCLASHIAHFIGDGTPCTIKLVGTSLMLINNVSDAATIFEFAKRCRGPQLRYSKQLFNLSSLRADDNIALSLSSHLLAHTSGFIDFPANSIHISHRPVINGLSFSSQSVCNLTGINYVRA